MFRTTSLAFSLVALFALSPDASAQARHERVKITKLSKNGKTVGARLSLTYRASTNARSGSLVLGDPAKRGAVDYRSAASGRGGYVVGKLDVFKNLDPATPTERTLTIDYARFGLKGGEKLDLTSVWNAGSFLHVWGMTRSGAASMPIKLPD